MTRSLLGYRRPVHRGCWRDLTWPRTYSRAHSHCCTRPTYFATAHSFEHARGIRSIPQRTHAVHQSWWSSLCPQRCSGDRPGDSDKQEIIETRGEDMLTVSTHHTNWPLASCCVLQEQSDDVKDSSCLARLSSPPAGARMIRPLEVTMTSLWRFFVVLLPKKRDSFLWPSSPLPLPPWDNGVTITMRSPSRKIRSLVRVRTGDHSISSCVGGGSSVMMRDGRLPLAEGFT